MTDARFQFLVLVAGSTTAVITISVKLINQWFKGPKIIADLKAENEKIRADNSLVQERMANLKEKQENQDKKYEELVLNFWKYIGGRDKD